MGYEKISLLAINTTYSMVLKLKGMGMLMHAVYKYKTGISMLINKLSWPELSRIFYNKREVSVALTNRKIYVPLLSGAGSTSPVFIWGFSVDCPTFPG